MAKNKKNRTPGNGPAKAGKITFKGYKEPGLKLGAVILGLIAAVVGQQAYHKVRPDALTPTGTTGLGNNLKIYAEPAILLIGGLTGYQLVKNNFWKNFLMGVAALGTIEIFDSVAAATITKKPILNQLYGFGEANQNLLQEPARKVWDYNASQQQQSSIPAPSANLSAIR